MGYYIALDVGGTNIKSGVIDDKGNLLDGIVRSYDAKAKESKEIISSNLTDIIKEQAYSAPKLGCINGIGFAFPGPFDYDKGISYISGINKYDSLYGINIKDELLSIIYTDDFLKNKLDKSFSIVFDNDANLYALGEHYHGKGKGYHRSIYICLGTGIGSAFIENGHLIKSGKGIPENGWVYDSPFMESIVDDYISSRGILRLTEGITGKNLKGGVKELAEAARVGDNSAKQVFDTFGTLMGKALLPFIKDFEPEAIVFGGQIAKSLDLFKAAFYSAISPFKPVIEVSQNSSISTLLGVYDFFKG